MKDFAILPIMPAMAGTSSLFSTLTGGHTVGGFVLGLLALCGGVILIRYLFWLILRNNNKKIFESRYEIRSHLEEFINGRWSNRPRSAFVIGEFEGKYKERKTVFKVMAGWGYDLAETYLLLKPNTHQPQNLPVPSMSFHFSFRRYVKVTENTYLKGGWLIHKPKLSYGQFADEFYGNKQNFIQTLEELTRAAEIIEAKPLV